MSYREMPAPERAPIDPHRRITSKRVRELCGGVSDMWIWRRLADDTGFPEPARIAGRRYWVEAEVLAWLDAQAEKAA